MFTRHNRTCFSLIVMGDPCTHTGSASVQVVSPKIRFTITDRTTTNNTCAVQ
jgi:hypothetical protein